MTVLPTSPPVGSPGPDFADLFDTAPCGYIVTGADCRIVRANRTLARWLGQPADALAGRHFSELLTMGAALYFETHFAPMLRMNGAVEEIALDLREAGGAKIPALVNAAEQHDDKGNLVSIRIIVFRAKERRRYERNLLEAKSAAEDVAGDVQLRERFMAILGHDLRNPLAAISSGLSILKREKPSERALKVVGLMEASVVRASVLIDNVLDFARGRLGGGIELAIDAEKPLQPVIEQVVAELRLIAPTRQIVTSLDMAEPVAVDHARMGQLVSNLLSNALTHGANDYPVTLDAVSSGGQFRLSIANGGEPIPADVIPGLFRPFVRGDAGTGQQGLGLGLHIASEIAKAHGGTLTATSSGAETRFTFEMACGA